MAFPAALVGKPLLRSYICEDYELRITRRCLEEDLGRDPDEPFADLLNRARPEIVTAFVNERCDSPTGTRLITPLSSGREVSRLGRGHDHRGGTWHDRQREVVWLLAYRLHRSGADDDLFPYAKDLDAAGRLLPTAADYQALFDDQGFRAAKVAQGDAQDLLAQARQNEGDEIRGEIGGSAGVGVMVHVVETASEIFLALDTTRVPAAWMPLIPPWFVPESGADQWETPGQFPGRDLNPGEVALCYLKED